MNCALFRFCLTIIPALSLSLSSSISKFVRCIFAVFILYFSTLIADNYKPLLWWSVVFRFVLNANHAVSLCGCIHSEMGATKTIQVTTVAGWLVPPCCISPIVLLFLFDERVAMRFCMAFCFRGFDFIFHKNLVMKSLITRQCHFEWAIFMCFFPPFKNSPTHLANPNLSRWLALAFPLFFQIDHEILIAQLNVDVLVKYFRNFCN